MSLSDSGAWHASKLPLTLITGFLGAGKSTFLKHLLHGEEARDTVVLVNEFGAVGLDHLLIGAMDPSMILLDNGCICCTIRGDLQTTLNDLLSQRIEGSIPPFKRVILETTGLATPSPIIATILVDPKLQHHFVLQSVVTLVDVVHAEEQAQHHEEWYAQVIAADHIIVSKSDCLADSDLGAKYSFIQQKNPAANLYLQTIDSHETLRITTDTGHPLDSLTPILSPGRWEDPLARLTQGSTTQKVFDTSHQQFGKLAHRSNSTSSINAYTLRIDRPIQWQIFTLWFTMLLHRYGNDILRVKGILYVEGSDEPIALHAIQHLIHPVQHLTTLAGSEEKSSVVVFITQSLDLSDIQDSYERFARRLEQ